MGSIEKIPVRGGGESCSDEVLDSKAEPVYEISLENETICTDHAPNAASKFLAGAVIIDRENPFQENFEESIDEIPSAQKVSDGKQGSIVYISHKPTAPSGKVIKFKNVRKTCDGNPLLLKNKKPTAKPRDLAPSSSNSINNNNVNLTPGDSNIEDNGEVWNLPQSTQRTSNTNLDVLDSCNNTLNLNIPDVSSTEIVYNAEDSRSIDGYASLIQNLTMNEKRKKRTNLKNIFPSLYSKQKKKSEPSVVSEESSGNIDPVNNANAFSETNISTAESNTDTSDIYTEQSLTSPEYKLSYIYSSADSKLTNKSGKTDVIDQHDFNNEKSASSSSSTLVSDGSHDKENLRKKTQIILQRKGSLKNDNIFGGNNFFSRKEKSGRVSAPITTDFPVDLNDAVDSLSSFPFDNTGKMESTKRLITPKPLRLKPSTVLSNVGYSMEEPLSVNRKENTIVKHKKGSEHTDFVPESSSSRTMTDTFYHEQRTKPNDETIRFGKYINKETDSLITLRPREISTSYDNQYEDLISVGAQMKISTTKVMISPKKETDVKNNKELRAQTLVPQSRVKIDVSDKPSTEYKDKNNQSLPTTNDNSINLIGNEKLATNTYDKQLYHKNTNLEQSSSYMMPISPVTVLPLKKPKVSNVMKICRPIFLESIPDNSSHKYSNEIATYTNEGKRCQIKSYEEQANQSVDSITDVNYQKFIKNQIQNRSSPLPANTNPKAISPNVNIRGEPKYTAKCDSTNLVAPNSLTPQKIRNLKNVEAFYWQQLKKIKYAQEYELTQKAISATDIITDTTSLSALTDYSNYNRSDIASPHWRCRSVSPGFSRTSDRRSLSLPRHNEPLTHTNMSINNISKKEDYAFENPVSPQSNPNFVRNSPKRYTIGATNNLNIRRNCSTQPLNIKDYEQRNTEDVSVVQKMHNPNEANTNPIYGVVRRPHLKLNETTVTPIFRRGSLSDSGHDVQYREKRVSFSSMPNHDEYKLNLELEKKYTPQHQVVTDNAPSVVPRHPRQAIQLQPKNSYISDNRDERHIYGKIMKKDQNEGVYALIKNNHHPEQVYHDYASKVTYPNNKNNICMDRDNIYGNVFRFPEKVHRPDDVQRRSAADAAKNLISRRVSGVNSQPSAGGSAGRPGAMSESESGSEAGEVQRIMLGGRQLIMPINHQEEEWNPDGKNRGDGAPSEGGRGRVARRDDPRRHTLGGDLLRSAPPHSALLRGMDIEPPLPRGYPPPSSAMLFDDDPGIMSEVETASTGFRRGGKQRSSLPVVRTPSKTLERPLGLVFLQYRSETKRALLPNEITSIDTVKALFVRSFPKQLTMEYLDSPLVKIYIHDSSKDMFYELEDLRSHLRDIRDRSVLRLFESADVSGGAFPGALGGAVGMPAAGPPGSGPPSWDQDQNYFSEPEFDSEYHHQHIHKSKVNAKPPAYYMGSGAPSTLPRGGSLMRAYSPASGPPIPADRIKSLPGSADRIHNDGYMSSPERGSRGAYEEPYYTQYVGPPRGGMTPVIDEESGDPSMMDDQYSLYSVKIPSGPRPAVRGAPYEGNRLNAHSEDLQQRMRVEHMERQLANLTGLVQKALQAPGAAQSPRDFSPGGPHFRNSAQDKSVSFEKSVSFSDEPPDMNSPKQHSPQHAADTKPPKPAIKSSTLPRMSSQERDRLKPVPPPKPKALVGAPGTIVVSGGQQMVMMQSMDYYSQLKCLQKRCKDLRMEMRNLRRMTLTQAHTMREMICDTFMKFRTATSGGGDFNFHEDSMRLAREEEIYKQEMLKLEADLSDLESTVEQLRGNVINRKTRVNMVDVEKMALVLSKSSKTVADLKVRFPSLHEGMKGMLSNEMEKVVREEKFLKEEPERLELALRRCKKLTGTLVTLKRLASVQEQRLPCDGGRISPGGSGMSMDDQHLHENNSAHSKGSSRGMGCESGSGGLAPLSLGGGISSDATQRTENALDALLDELQTFARPPSPGAEDEGEESGLLRRLRVCPVSSDAELSPPVAPRGQAAAKPPVPERNPDLLQMAGRRAPPPPPPRTSSRSPLASPAALHPMLSASNSSSCDSVDSQEGVSKTRAPSARHDLLEQRHQELLKKQKALQEQYARLQQIQRGGNSLTVVPPPDLKKTGSESNLISKMGLNMSPAAPISGSLTHLAGTFPRTQTTEGTADSQATFLSTTSKIYETDIL